MPVLEGVCGTATVQHHGRSDGVLAAWAGVVAGFGGADAALPVGVVELWTSAGLSDGEHGAAAHGGAESAARGAAHPDAGGVGQAAGGSGAAGAGEEGLPFTVVAAARWRGGAASAGGGAAGVAQCAGEDGGCGTGCADHEGRGATAGAAAACADGVSRALQVDEGHPRGEERTQTCKWTASKGDGVALVSLRRQARPAVPHVVSHGSPPSPSSRPDDGPAPVGGPPPGPRRHLQHGHHCFTTSTRRSCWR